MNQPPDTTAEAAKERVGGRPKAGEEKPKANSPQVSERAPQARDQAAKTVGAEEVPDSEDARDTDGAEDQPGGDDKPDREAAKYRRERNELRSEVERLRGELAQMQRENVAREFNVPVEEVGGDTPDAMRESATAFAARIEAEVKRRGIGPAAPASAVTSSGKPPLFDSDDSDTATWSKLFVRVRDGATDTDA